MQLRWLGIFLVSCVLGAAMNLTAQANTKLITNAAISNVAGYNSPLVIDDAFIQSQQAQSLADMPNEEILIELKWRHQFQFAGYYAALEQGFFADEGLQVRLLERDPGTNIIQRVIDHEVHYGISDSILLLHQANDVPIVLVAAILQHSANAILTLADSGIREPRDLLGQRISFYDSDSDGVDILALLASQGVLNPRLYRQRWDERIDSLLNNEVDAVSIYITNEPFQLQEQGVSTNLLYPRNFGFDLYGDLLFTSADEVAANPARVLAVRRAVIRGWSYALNHPEEMIDLILAKYNSQNKSRAALEHEARGIAALVSEFTVPIGTIDAARIRYLQQRLESLGLVVSGSVTDGALAFTDWKGHLDLSEDELQFLAELPPIRLGVESLGWPPFEMLDEHGDFRGIAADYLVRISEMLGVEFTFENPLTWQQIMLKARNRELDLLPMAASTPSRRDFMIFTQPLVRSPMIIVTRDDVEYIADIRSLGNEKLGIVEGYASDELLQLAFPELNLQRFGSSRQGLRALAGGEIYAFVDNLTVASFVIKTEGLANLKISGQTPYSFDLSIGIRNDWPLLASAIDKALATITPEEHAEIYNRWVQLSLTEQVTWRRAWPIAIGGVVILLILLAYLVRLRVLNERVYSTNQRLAAAEVELREKNKLLRVLSVTDKLTNVYNRRHLDVELNKAFEHAKRYERPLSVVVFDLDHFKHINDEYGHQVGDEVLQKFAQLVIDNIRQSDVFGRWGGEEFLLICKETPVDKAFQVAEKIRRKFAALEYSAPINPTVSAGVAEDSECCSAEELVKRADRQLYQAKLAGRNSVFWHQ